MEKVVYRRTIRIADYETLTIETFAEHSDLNTARLLAVQKYLSLVRQELIRIYNIKLASNGNAYDIVEAELAGVYAEIQKLGD